MVNRIVFRLLATLFLLAMAGCSAPDRPSISLYLAIQRGDIDQIERHIYWGADINNAIDDEGRRPLHLAAAKGDIVVVRLLLKHQAEVNVPDSARRTPIEYALAEGRTQIADLLTKSGADINPSSVLLELSAGGLTDRDTIHWLLDNGAEPDHRGTDGDTPLLIAIRRGNHRLVRHLIDRGADVNVRDKSGVSALEVARRLNLTEIQKLLRRHGALEHRL